MESYAYIIIDKNGKEKKGTMEAINEDKVTSSLRADGYIPISVSRQNMLNKDINISIGKPVKERDLSVFCRQFVSILSAGVSIIHALDMLYEQTENKVLSQSIKLVQVAVEKGETLANAMRANKKVFPSILIHMVEAGEASGNLEISFERMAVHFEKDTKMKAQIKKAMIYPIMIGIVAVCVIFAMMILVIPSFIGMFADMDVDLPFMTRFVVNMSNFFTTKWYLILLIIVGIIVSFSIYKKSSSGKMLLGSLAFKLPLFGKLTVKSTSSRFARTLSTLLAAGIPMIEAIDITSRTIDNAVTKSMLSHAKEEVAKGVPLSIPLRRSGIFPPMVYHMTKIGEETGNIESMLEKMADYYDEEVDIATQSLIAVMEPLIIVVLAGFVGVIIMAIMQPLLAMYDGIGNL